MMMVLLQNSVNARYETIPYPWLVFGEKVKVNTVFIRDSTGVSDSILILFGGALACGVQVILYPFYRYLWYLLPVELAEFYNQYFSCVQAGHLKMLDGYIDFFMDHTLAECFLKLKEELDKLLQKKVSWKRLSL